MKFWIPKSINIQTMTESPGSRTSRHAHNYIQAGYILSGFLMVALDRRHLWKINAGEYFNIAQYQPHIIESSSKVAAASLDLRFKGRLVGGTGLVIDEPGIRSMGTLVNETFKITAPHARKIGTILKEMLTFDTAPDDIRTFILVSRMMHLAEHVAQAPRLKYHRRRESGHEHRVVLNVLDIIHQHYDQPLTIKTMSADIGVSRGHLIRLFRRYIGVTPKQYLLHHRIESAKRFMMLRDTQSLKIIASLTGFPDLQQFSRAFHRIEGCAPSEFLA
ncbi:MAG: AraC family transcriptional regulator [Verrucomicrobia bacterium]|nr:AraC family transcriptional regulator [Verrucomicrobiota bacterium]MBU1736298.1 AraC family transcriptional regulator [Verrucomicrobiota bacterium]MBU1857671.1 AraC family transcriptional regulator [Verrucomicrobiota bacterium]